MWGSNVVRAKDQVGAPVRSTRCHQPEVLERSDDSGKSSPCCPARDVLPEDILRPHLFDDAAELPEEPRAFPVKPALPAGPGEVLAGCPARDDIHLAAPRAAVEGGEVIPDRSAIQGLGFHPGHEDGRSEGFPFDVADGA